MQRRTALSAALGLALAACAFSLPATAGDEIELQVTPAGHFKPSDGRELPVDAWHIDAAIASRVIDRFKSRKTQLVIDYEHQTLKKEENGQPAPAAAWFKSLEWRDGEAGGLWATVSLTARAKAAIDAHEYRYFSPVFTFDPRTGDVVEVVMGALTNYPAIDGMEPLALRAAATFGLTGHHTQEPAVAKLLSAVCMALSLPAATTEDQAVTAIQALKAGTGDPLKDVRTALGLQAEADGTAIVAACTALKANQVDPAKFVPLAVVEQVKGALAALSAKLQGDEISKLVEAGLAEGKLLPAQEAWARDLGKTNLAALTSYLATAQPIAALTSTQTGGRGPGAKNDKGLTADEMAVCSAMGLTPEQFKAGGAAAA
ncbi:hypothetical protein CKO44_16090 [Rubrivivax gelatinosus]|uniref:phage protease n=1 Tax=Rubrivivax gelatinosus TaxID=28068 RepID=UPI001905CE1C|nr:phage protease [Rubrivivax gelatinosus]MBK1614990.1 hypothetical protein [Rubrivivax gelatinosus]